MQGGVPASLSTRRSVRKYHRLPNSGGRCRKYSVHLSRPLSIGDNCLQCPAEFRCVENAVAVLGMLKVVANEAVVLLVAADPLF